MPSASAAAISAASASRVIMVPVGLAGLATSTPLSGFCRCAAISASGDSTQRVVGRGLDQHRLAAERGQDVAVRRIAGIGERHPVAGLEQRQERQDEAAGRTGGDHHAAGIEREAVGVRIVAGDARAQRRHAERLGIADAAVGERARAACRATAGAGAAGWPTSMWTMCAPVASSRAAAAITSMTMNGGTSLRREGLTQLFGAFRASFTGFLPLVPRPAVAAFAGLLGLLSASCMTSVVIASRVDRQMARH